METHKSRHSGLSERMEKLTFGCSTGSLSNKQKLHCIYIFYKKKGKKKYLVFFISIFLDQMENVTETNIN